MKTLLLILITAALAAAGGWFAARKSASPSATSAAEGRKVAFYQSPMHPWIKSGAPGNCTICGMKLAPVYEGEKGFEAAGNVISLSTNAVNAIHVQTSEVRPRSLTRTLRVAGRVDDNDTRHAFVSAYVDGRIEKLAVNYVGAEVVEGEPLAVFYSPALLTAAQEYLSLVRRKGALPESAAHEGQSLLDSAGERLKRLGLTEAQIGQLASEGSAGAQIEIKAPMTGTVVQRFAYEGMYVKEGDKLFEIADFRTMWFLFDAYEQDLAWLKLGQAVEVSVPSVPGKTFGAPIAFIDPTLDESTRSAKVRVELENPLIEENGRKRRELLHRVFADGRINAEAGTVLAVARAAVISAGGDPSVYVEISPGNYEHRRVKLGRAGDEFWEVLEGVSEGEKVVTNGNLLIDSQAQLQRGSGTEHAHQTNPATSSAHGDHGKANAVSGPMERLSAPQAEAARALLAVAHGIADALAAEDLARFNTEAVKLHGALPALKSAFGGSAGWNSALKKLDETGHLAEAKDLLSARKAFFPFSQAAAEFARALRKQAPEFSTIKVFRCPMVSKEISPQTKTGYWTQSQGPLRNPFFGPDMLDCGTEVAE